MPDEVKFKFLNREAGLIAESLTSGLENLRKVSRDQSFYYQSFYSLSIGLERLMKLIIYLNNPENDLRSFGHDLVVLSANIGISPAPNSIENKILIFLNSFAKGKRYCIIDFLSSGNADDLGNEPIIKFYNDVIKEVLSIHPARWVWLPPNVDFALVRHTSEDLTGLNSLYDLILHSQIIDHASKYCVMYAGRLLQPFLVKLSEHGNVNDNPYFSEHFRFLIQPDPYFLNRKTFRS